MSHSFGLRATKKDAGKRHAARLIKCPGVKPPKCNLCPLHFCHRKGEHLVTALSWLTNRWDTCVDGTGAVSPQVSRVYREFEGLSESHWHSAFVTLLGCPVGVFHQHPRNSLALLPGPGPGQGPTAQPFPAVREHHVPRGHLVPLRLPSRHPRPQPLSLACTFL